jgi:hypothetical protein
MAVSRRAKREQKRAAEFQEVIEIGVGQVEGESEEEEGGEVVGMDVDSGNRAAAGTTSVEPPGGPSPEGHEPQAAVASATMVALTVSATSWEMPKYLRFSSSVMMLKTPPRCFR